VIIESKEEAPLPSRVNIAKPVNVRGPWIPPSTVDHKPMVLGTDRGRAKGGRGELTKQHL